MFIYSSNALDFRKAVDTNQITEKIETSFIQKMGKRPTRGEKSAWNNSMRFMESVIRNSRVADDCGILIEYNIPATSRRIDFIIAGTNEEGQENFIVVELKQWDQAQSTDKDGVVVAFVGGNHREMAHPSYQAWSYRQQLSDMNEAIYINDLQGYACAYLHNYREAQPEPLKAAQYQNIIRQTPLFFSEDYDKLQKFMYKHVGKGKGINLLYLIENGKIRPSKKLIDHIGRLFNGNQAFVLLDEQKVAYETILHLAKKADQKTTIIVQGGPGTGKSVVSMNAFGGLLKERLNVKFVAPNASFRDVMVEMLTSQNLKGKMRIRSLFTGSSSFYDAPENFFDVLIVDEAHRLKNKQAYQYLGENQVEDVIKAAKVSVFFIDDGQRIRPEDIGTVAEIQTKAEAYHAEVHHIALTAQFRCSGAEGFLNWIDDVLQIKETGNFNGWDKEAFEFRLCDTPNELYRIIQEKNSLGHRARMLAGFAWPWTKERNHNGEVPDVAIEEHDFSMPWNSRSFRSTWAIKEDGVGQIGCVHTSQGLEFDYVGIIIGNDLKYDSAEMKLYADYDEYKDVAGKKGLRHDRDKLTELVKNIYKILMSRGMKGCYVFCRDREMQAYFRKRLENAR